MENEILNNSLENDGGTTNTEETSVETTPEQSTSVSASDPQEPQENTQEEAPIKSFTQEQVNDVVRNRIDRFYTRYGCKNKQELDDLVGKSQSYDVMKDRYGDLQVENAKLNQELTFIKNNIDEARYDDIKAYFKGKGLEFNNDALVNELATHQEWLKQEQQPTPTTTIRVMGSEQTSKPKVSEKDLASKMFGVNL